MQKEVEETGFLYTSASSFCKTCQTRHAWTPLAVSMWFKQGKHKCWKQFPLIFLTCIQSEFRKICMDLGQLNCFAWVEQNPCALPDPLPDRENVACPSPGPNGAAKNFPKATVWGTQGLPKLCRGTVYGHCTGALQQDSPLGAPWAPRAQRLCCLSPWERERLGAGSLISERI